MPIQKLSRPGRWHGFVALADLRLDQLWVVYPGRRSFPLDDRIEAVGMNDLQHRLAAWDQRPS